MKEVPEVLIEALEEVSEKGAQHLKAFFDQGGDSPILYKKARMAATVISGYAKVRSSETTRAAVELAEKRLEAGVVPMPLMR